MSEGNIQKQVDGNIELQGVKYLNVGLHYASESIKVSKKETMMKKIVSCNADGAKVP